MAASTVETKVLCGGWSIHSIQQRILETQRNEENIDH